MEWSGRTPALPATNAGRAPKTTPARDLQMSFALFALAIAAAFFASSLVLLNYGRHLGLRYLQQQKDAVNMAGLTTVEGAVFALIGLLLAFTISGALQRFDERRQLVVQESNA